MYGVNVADNNSDDPWGLFLYLKLALERGYAETVMAKNFVEEGKTVVTITSAATSSGDLVRVGDVFAAALTDIPQGEIGGDITEGVFMLPRLKTGDMKTGKKVYLKSERVQLTNSDSDLLVRVAWAGAGTSVEEAPAKLNV